MVGEAVDESGSLAGMGALAADPGSSNSRSGGAAVLGGGEAPHGIPSAVPSKEPSPAIATIEAPLQVVGILAAQVPPVAVEATAQQSAYISGYWQSEEVPPPSVADNAS